MAIKIYFWSVIFFCVAFVMDLIEAPDSQSLIRGSHLRIIPYHLAPGIEVLRNSSGHIVNVTGMLIPALQWLAQVLDFTYEFNQDDGNLPIFIENRGPTQPGMVSFLQKNEADLLIGIFGTAASRNEMMDLPYPLFKNQLALMIPKPKLEERSYFITAMWKPFQLQVWLCLAISIGIGTVSLYALGLIRARIYTNLRYKHAESNSEKIIPLEKSWIFILGMILMQGSASSRAIGRNTNLVVRFLTGAWCLTCFVLITAYSSVLVSFLTTLGDYKPLVNSVNDLPKQPQIRVTVNKDLFADVLFQSAMNDPDAGILKFLGQELKRHPEFRFPTSQQCFDQVRKGSSVYIFTSHLVRAAIGKDWKNTGRCDFILAKEKFLMVLTSGFFLQKNGPYREYFSREIMRMEGAGLLEFLLKQYSDDPTYCLTKIQRQMKEKSGKRRLTLRNLSSAFLVLIIGYVLSIIALILELFSARPQLRIKNKKAVVPRKPVTVDTAKVVIDRKSEANVPIVTPENITALMKL